MFVFVALLLLYANEYYLNIFFPVCLSVCLSGLFILTIHGSKKQIGLACNILRKLLRKESTMMMSKVVVIL